MAVKSSRRGEPAVEGVAATAPLDDLLARVTEASRRELVALAERAGVPVDPQERQAARREVDVAVGEHEAASVTRAWEALLALVGDSGLVLSEAGEVRPPDVRALVEEAALGGASGPDREDLDASLRSLRESSVAAGLLRVGGGRLLLTPTGRSVAHSPSELWRVVAAQLPGGRVDRERHAGVVLLVAVAAGAGAATAFASVAPTALAAVGWRGSGPDHAVTGADAWAWARPTEAMLAIAGGISTVGDGTARGRRLARAALLRV